MPAGLILRDAANNVILDTTTRIGRILGIGNTGSGDGSVTPAGTDTGVLWAIPLIGIQQCIDHANSDSGFLALEHFTMTVTSTTVSWSWGGFSHTFPIDFLYGVR